MGNLIVATLVLSILAKIIHHLVKQYRLSGTLCPSCPKCIYPSNSLNEPLWLQQYRDQSMKKGAL